MDDCKLAHAMMSVETDSARLRVQWIGALALLRLVGDALSKLDAESYPFLKDDIKSHWLRLNSEREEIFWNFIKGSRDRAVHWYDIDLDGRTEISVLLVGPDGEAKEERFTDCLFVPLLDGFGVGEDARDVYLQAISWWDRELSQFEGS